MLTRRIERRLAGTVALAIIGEMVVRRRPTDPELLAGLCLAFALRSALANGRAPVRLAWLTAAGLAHANGWRGTRNGNIS